MKPDSLADTLADLGAASVLCQRARAALEGGDQKTACDFARTARTVLCWAIQSLTDDAPQEAPQATPAPPGSFLTASDRLRSAVALHALAEAAFQAGDQSKAASFLADSADYAEEFLALARDFAAPVDNSPPVGG